jgi:hypothetical protein
MATGRSALASGARVAVTTTGDNSVSADATGHAAPAMHTANNPKRGRRVEKRGMEFLIRRGRAAILQ